MRVSEIRVKRIRVKRIRVNQGLGVYILLLSLIQDTITRVRFIKVLKLALIQSYSR